MLLALLACTGTKDSNSSPDTGTIDPVSYLTAPGPWNVGYTTETVTYNAPDGTRSLRLAIWYPTAQESGDKPGYLFLDPAMPVIDGASTVDESFPLVVFSHGHQGFAENSAFLMQHLASHGLVVAAPDHTGNTTSDGSDRTTEIYYQRPLDISAVLDYFESETGKLAGLTKGPVVALGHSFGGYTIFALAGGQYSSAMLDFCETDTSDPFCSTMDADKRARFEAGFLEPRIAAFMPMAAGDFDKFEAEGLGVITAPVLHMTATEDQGPGSEADDIWNALSKPGSERVILDGAGHQSFTDFADLLEQVTLDAQDGFDIVNGYGLAFVESAQGKDWASVLSGELSLSASAEVVVGM